jgi:phosphate transport system protein
VQRRFDELYKALKEKLLDMGGLCEKMIHMSIKALLEKNLEHGASILEYEDKVNRYHVEIDDLCTRLLALQTPVASDLRGVIAALKINNDLERIADQACNISQNTFDLLKAPKVKLHPKLPEMSQTASAMLKDALNSYVQKDCRLAEHVLTMDAAVNALKQEIFDAQLMEMMDNSAWVQRGLDLILISRNLEKIGDHATNIAEDVIFMVKGQDIRHHATMDSKRH